MPPARLVVAAEIFSPNLGDGVIYACLSGLFRSIDPDIEILPLDISGRQSWGDLSASRARLHRLIALSKARVGGVYSLANWLRLSWSLDKVLLPRWRELLQPASALVIGGGQLLMDNHLEFPVRLNALAHLAEEMDKALYLAACGVGLPWSAPARRMLANVLQRARSISLRDQQSCEWLQAQFPQARAFLTCDPAIWAAQIYGSPPERRADTIGLGVINPGDARLRLPGKPAIRGQVLQDSWLALIAALQRQGWKVELFTNGSPSDEAFAHSLCRRANEAGIPTPGLAARPQRPGELASRVGSYAGVIAARLHAVLLAFAYRVPCVALAWDAKVEAFLEDVGLPEARAPFPGFDPLALATQLENLMQSQPAPPGLEACQQRALLAARTILEDLAAV